MFFKEKLKISDFINLYIGLLLDSNILNLETRKNLEKVIESDLTEESILEILVVEVLIFEMALQLVFKKHAKKIEILDKYFEFVFVVLPHKVEFIKKFNLEALVGNRTSLYQEDFGKMLQDGSASLANKLRKSIQESQSIKNTFALLAAEMSFLSIQLTTGFTFAKEVNEKYNLVS